MDTLTTRGTTSVVRANSLLAEWKQFGAFLKRPQLPDRAPMPNLASVAAVLRMLGLDLVIMIVLLGIAGAVMSSGIDLPETALSGMEITGAVVFAAVIVAPIAEEIVFRGWLSGRPGHILALALLIGGGMGAAVVAGTGTGTGDLQAMGSAALAGFVSAVLAGAAIFLLRRRGAIGWFARFFPAFFWLSTVGFACVHLLNFPPEQIAMALPLVLPQFATGAILGYLRVNHGLWASMLLHLLHNGAFISLVLLASGAGA